MDNTFMEDKETEWVKPDAKVFNTAVGRAIGSVAVSSAFKHRLIAVMLHPCTRYEFSKNHTQVVLTDKESSKKPSYASCGIAKLAEVGSVIAIEFSFRVYSMETGYPYVDNMAITNVSISGETNDFVRVPNPILLANSDLSAHVATKLNGAQLEEFETKLMDLTSALNSAAFHPVDIRHASPDMKPYQYWWNVSEDEWKQPRKEEMTIKDAGCRAPYSKKRTSEAKARADKLKQIEERLIADEQELEDQELEAQKRKEYGLSINI